jgi:hypothetical protein
VAYSLYQRPDGAHPSGFVKDPETGETVWIGQPPRRRWWQEALARLARRSHPTEIVPLALPAGVATGYPGAMPPALQFSSINQRHWS